MLLIHDLISLFVVFTPLTLNCSKLDHAERYLHTTLHTVYYLYK